MPCLLIKLIINKAFVASSEDIITDYNDLYCLFMRYVSRIALRKYKTMSAFVIGEMTNNKRYSTPLKKLAFESSVANSWNIKNVLTGCESEAPDSPCKVGLPHFIETDTGIVGYFHRKQSSCSAKCAAHIWIFGLNCSGTVLNHWFLVVSSFGWLNKVVSLSQWNTQHLHNMAVAATARIKVMPSFFAWTFGRCYANLPTSWRRHVGAC